MIRTAKTENGLVRGLPAADPRITAFRGIPFAAPPVGENRWRAPQPCENWSGVRKAYRFGPISVQDTPGLGDNIYCREWHVDPEIPMSEDCLYLNVWTGARKAGEKQPVLVWFFGGGLQWGYTAEMEFDGERLARRGVVVVTVNYRLNVFGFLAHPELTKEQPDAPANFGNLDQRAGLEWVIRNIAEFGGDPENITIAGQSAGGGSVVAQLTSPGSIGLFQRAVVMSGMIRSPYRDDPFLISKTLSEAETNGESFLKYLGAPSLSEARQLDAVYIRDRYAEYVRCHPMMATVIDNKFCIGDTIRLFLENRHAQVPIMAGNTADEFPNVISAASEEAYRAAASELFGDRAEEFLSFREAWEMHGEGNYAPVSGIECTVKTLFEQVRETGGAQNCYYYRFAPDIPGWDNPGTFHSVDLWFFFETLAKCWRPFVGRHYDLARQMCNYFCNFIRSGDPNGADADGSAMPEWKPYRREEGAEMVFTSAGAVPGGSPEKGFRRFLMESIKKKTLG
mgnify:FL=1